MLGSIPGLNGPPKIIKGEQPIINGDGDQTRDYVYVGDVVDAVVLSLGKKMSAIYNLPPARD